MVNKSLRRKLNELKVYCIYKETGCKWIGDLGKLEKHLTIGESIGECQFVIVKCTVSNLCKVKILRNSLKHHVDNVCQYRQFQCEHCSYQSTYLMITTEHFDQCPKYPLHCPNNCSKQTHPRDQLDIHLASCPEQEVDCTFSAMGCREKVKRQHLQHHLSTNLLQHQMIMCQAYHAQNETIASLQRDKLKLQEQVTCLTRNIEKLQIFMPTTKEVDWPLYLHKISQIASISPIAPIILEVPFKVGVTEKSPTHPFYFFAPPYHSPSFYSHHCGYKLKLSVKFVHQSSSHMLGYLLAHDLLTVIKDETIYGISVELCAVDGEYDDQLEWPFEEKVNITLMNKERDDQHHKIEKWFQGDMPGSQLQLRNDQVKKQRIIEEECKQLELNAKTQRPTKLLGDLLNLYCDSYQTKAVVTL